MKDLQKSRRVARLLRNGGNAGVNAAQKAGFRPQGCVEIKYFGVKIFLLI
jgi:hypothetical protein